MRAAKKEFVITPKEEFAYGHIIEALAGGLYPNKFHVIREYIQNGFDAIVHWKKEGPNRIGKIRISMQQPSIFVLDDGTGMDKGTLGEYRKVGFSKKAAGEFAGFRGIGKLAGISVAKQLVVTTSPNGVPEKYILTFDSQRMLDEINKLKAKQENIPLNTLIEKHTTLDREVEKPGEHYTMVELREIRSDSRVLFNREKLASYISRNAPVPFDPAFEYGGELEEEISRFVDDYDCVETTVDEINVYKPFVGGLRLPQHIVVWDKGKEQKRAFCWYCENPGKGQIQPTKMGGLVYRYKNFAVGDNYLTRKSIWNTSAHLAFYFMGEIYITDSAIVPTSQRDDFEQNLARDSFYKDAKVIASELNSIARRSSDVRRASDYVNRGYEVVSKISEELKEKKPYLRDLGVEKIAQLHQVVENIEKREKNIPDEDRKTKRKARKVVNRARKLLQHVQGVTKTGTAEFDIIKRLRLSKQSAEVYSIAVNTIRDYFQKKPEELERVINNFQANLINAFSKGKE